MTLKAIAHQAPLSMGILQARIPEWVSCPSLGDLPDPGIEPTSLMSPALTGSLPPVPPGKPTSSPLKLSNSKKFDEVMIDK